MQRRWWMVYALAACGGSSSSPDAAVDAADVDARVPHTIMLDYARVDATYVDRMGHVHGPDGAVYARRGISIDRTTDDGATWTPRATVTAAQGFQLTATSTALFAAHADGLLRSTDGFASSTVLTLPSMPSGTQYGVHARGAQPSLWLAFTTATTVALWRSVNDGDSFEPIAPPSGTVTLPLVWFAGRDGALFLISGAQVHRTTDGAAWEDLGTFGTGINAVHAAADGTIVIDARDGTNSTIHRRASGGDTWTTSDTVLGVATLLARPSGGLVRVTFDGKVFQAPDDGAAFTEVTPTPASFPGRPDYAYDTAVTAGDLARWVSGSSEWVVSTPATLPEAIDIAFAPGGRVVAAGRRRVYVSTDNGATWRWGRQVFDDDVFTIRAVAVSPDGASIVVGSAAGRIGVLDGQGDDLVVPLYPFAGATEHVRQIVYTTPLNVVATTASDNNVDGNAYQGRAAASSSWQQLDPLRTPAGPEVPGGYHGAGACIVDQFQTMLVIGSRQPAGGSTVMDALHVRIADDQPWRTVNVPLVADPAHMVSCGTAPSDGPPPFALSFGPDEVFISYPTAGAVSYPVAVADLQGETIGAKLAPDNHLWVLSGGGVYRSTTEATP